MPKERYNIHEAKTQLSRLVEQAEQGKEIIICRAGKPVARLVPLAPQPKADREPGGLEGKIRVSEDFDLTPPEVLDAFKGRME